MEPLRLCRDCVLECRIFLSCHLLHLLLRQDMADHVHLHDFGLWRSHGDCGSAAPLPYTPVPLGAVGLVPGHGSISFVPGHPWYYPLWGKSNRVFLPYEAKKGPCIM